MAPSRGQRRRAIPRDAAKHLFSIGQSVRLKGGFETSPKLGDVYRITATLPPRDNLFQYRVRNDDERHERVTTQDCLEPRRLGSAGFWRNTHRKDVRQWPRDRNAAVARSESRSR